MCVLWKSDIVGKRFNMFKQKNFLFQFISFLFLKLFAFDKIEISCFKFERKNGNDI